MKRNYFFLAVAASLMLGSQPTAFAYNLGPDHTVSRDDNKRSAAWSPLRIMSLRDLPDAVRLAGTSPRAWPGPVSVRGASLADQVQLAKNNDRLVGWTALESLADEGRRSEVRALIEEGVPVLVTRERDEPLSHAAGAVATFGVSVEAQAAYYVRTPEGSLKIFSVASMSADADQRSRTMSAINDGLERWLKEVASKQSEASRLSGTRRQAVINQRASAPSTDVPRVEVSHTMFASMDNGASITQDISVVRDFSASHDRKMIVARSSYNIIPPEFLVGLKPNGVLRLVHAYRLRQDLELENVAGANQIAPTLHKQYPESNGSTDISFTETQRITTGFSTNISPELSNALTDKGAAPSGKVPFGFGFSRDNVEERSFNMTVKDYSVAASASKPEPLKFRSSWNLNLANGITGDPNYFGNKTLSDQRMTPMMRQASPQSYVAWSVPGTFTGTVTVRANSLFDGINYYGSGLRPNISVAEERHPSFDQAESVVTVDLNSPYLTREVTVLIKSQVEGGLCLTAKGATAPADVSLVTCKSSERALEQQWNFDAESRYRNRLTGRCLATNPQTGAAVMAVCSADLSQRWEWRADRLYSFFNGAVADWRLHVEGGRVLVKIDPAKFQDLPTNPFNNLLIPWSTYPRAPVKGAVVPSLTGVSPQIPEDFLRLRTVQPTERWIVTPLRQGI